MFVKWFSQKMVGPFFIFSFDSSTAEQAESANTNGRTPTNHGAIPHTTMMTTTHSTSRRSDSGTKHLQGGDHMPGRTRKTSRQFEKDKAAFFKQCKAQHAVCWLCGMPIDYNAVKNTTDDSFNLDHMFPVSKHPELQFDPAGFKPSHTSCNRLRGNSDPPAPIGTLSRQWITTA